MSSAFLSMNCSVHQNQIIGSWTIIGMNSCVTKSAIVEPGYKYFGVPARRRGENTVSLRRNDVTSDQLKAAKDKFLTLHEERGIVRTDSWKLSKERR
jgi:acyl-[acyl carrier protein]--UDP-N-acetylglucosamine O-acyltransferase